MGGKWLMKEGGGLNWEEIRWKSEIRRRVQELGLEKWREGMGKKVHLSGL
jgi:hypothetical protein